MSGPAIVGLVATILVIDSIMVWAIVRVASEAAKELARDYPGRPVPDGAVRRGFQSFKIGIMNLGWCIHVAVDQGYLHLQPTWLARRFGLLPISLPWGVIEIRERRWRKWWVRVGKHDVAGPPWCFQLADTRPPT